MDVDMFEREWEVLMSVARAEKFVLEFSSNLGTFLAQRYGMEMLGSYDEERLWDYVKTVAVAG